MIQDREFDEAIETLNMKDGAADDDLAVAKLAHRLSYSSCRRHQKPFSLRPRGARSSHWYMPHKPSSPRAYAE